VGEDEEGTMSNTATLTMWIAVLPQVRAKEARDL